MLNSVGSQNKISKVSFVKNTSSDNNILIDFSVQSSKTESDHFFSINSGSFCYVIESEEDSLGRVDYKLQLRIADIFPKQN